MPFQANWIDSLESKLSNFEYKYDTLNEKILELGKVITALKNRIKKSRSRGLL